MEQAMYTDHNMNARSSLPSLTFIIRRHLQEVANNNTSTDQNGTRGDASGSVHASTASNEHIRTILVILYICVLALCFVTPIFYYFRLRVEERNARLLRELEVAGIRSALERSSTETGESQAARRKYIEERRARILQLFGPVKMVLTTENFPHDVEPQARIPSQSLSHQYAGPIADHQNQASTEKDHDIEAAQDSCHADEDEETLLIKIPSPGLSFSSDYDSCYPSPPASIDAANPNQQAQPRRDFRVVSGTCTICLSSYRLGDEVVWSSNASCEHCFHLECIERWLLRQREGPLCPCCRRDFIIDPYDVQAGEDDGVASEGTSTLTQGVEQVQDDASSPSLVSQRPRGDAGEG